MAKNPGHPQTLVASHPGNDNAVTHGVFSRAAKDLSPEAQEIAEELLRLPHVSPSDRLACEEVGKLVCLIERCDAALADGRVEGRNGQGVRGLVDVRLRLSARLERWCAQLGLTPKAKAEIVSDIASGRTLASELRQVGEAR